MVDLAKKVENPSGRGAINDGEVVEANLAERPSNDLLLSSRTRLRIAELVSRRPRTLRELASLTNLSVPGVLRHLEAMDKAGLIREERVRSKTLPARKLYSLKGITVMDLSVGDISIFKVSRDTASKEKGSGDLQSLAMEIMVGRRRVRERARRLTRAIDELFEDEKRLKERIGSLGLTNEDRLILLTVFTEDTMEDATRVLTRIQGAKDARRSIDKALARAK